MIGDREKEVEIEDILPFNLNQNEKKRQYAFPRLRHVIFTQLVGH